MHGSPVLEDVSAASVVLGFVVPVVFGFVVPVEVVVVPTAVLSDASWPVCVVTVLWVLVGAVVLVPEGEG